MAGLVYDRVIRYKMTVYCDGPLRIGSADGDSESVLVDPTDGLPFIQASSIAGAMRAFAKRINIDEFRLFGSSDATEGSDSKIKVSEGVFKGEVRMELRPHVKINRMTGSVASVNMKGIGKSSGQKFNIEYIGTRQDFEFDVFVYDLSEDSVENEVESILKGFASESIRLGGKKSNGAGVVALKEAHKTVFNLKNSKDLDAWIRNDYSAEINYSDKLRTNEKQGLAYVVKIKGKSESGIQVKGLGENEFGKGEADSSNIQNVQGDYIVPGSSFKGTIRSQMEKIAEYLQCQDIIGESFGDVDDKKKAGNIFFKDTIIGDADSVSRIPLKHRLHIDKFTGGVINPFAEKNAAGELEFSIDIANRNYPQKTLGLLMFAIRDLAAGVISVGNGYANGKGFVKVSDVLIDDCINGGHAEINFGNGGRIVDETGIIGTALKTIKGVNT